MKLIFEIDSDGLVDLEEAMKEQFPIPKNKEDEPEYTDLQWVKYQVEEFLVGITDSNLYEKEMKKIKIKSLKSKILT